ncbi:MAG: hypothetical protein QXG48_04335 [Thermofilaceae archaeon]
MPQQEVKEVVFELPKDVKYLPCRVSAAFPVYNPNRSGLRVEVYTGLAIKVYKKPYMVALKSEFMKGEFVAPTGAIVRVRYASGSRSHIYYSCEELFLVSEVGERGHVFRVRGAHGKKDEVVEGVVKNMSPVDLTGFDATDIQAEIMNVYNAAPSNFDPVEALYFLWMKKRVADPYQAAPRADQELEEQIRKLEELIAQRERELEALREQLQQLRLKLQLEEMKKRVV